METIEDIVREMRVMARVSDNGYCAQYCAEYADRIEAAARAEHHKVAEELAELRAKAQKVDAKDQTRTINGLIDRIGQLVHRQSDLRKALEDAATKYCHLCHKFGCAHEDPDNNRPCTQYREWKALARGDR